MNAVFVEPYTLTIENAARYSGLSRSRIYELMSDNVLASFKIGRRRMIKAHDLKKLLDEIATGKLAG